MSDSLDWLPTDSPPSASCTWTDAKVLALVPGLVTIAVGVGSLSGQATPWRLVGAVLILLSLVYCARVARVRATVGPDGLEIRAVVRSRQLAWDDVVAVDTTSGPIWLEVLSDQPWRAKWRLTQRRTTSTVLRLREGTTVRPLALTRSRPSRRADEVTRIARQLATGQTL